MFHHKTLGILFLILLLGSIAVPNFRHARQCGSAIRRCHSMQKAMAGALEMYNLDKNSPRLELTEGVARLLVDGGYLQSMPRHVGFHERSGEFAWISTSGGCGIMCLTHGQPGRSETTPYEQLQGEDVSPNVLERASREPCFVMERDAPFRAKEQKAQERLRVLGWLILALLVAQAGRGFFEPRQIMSSIEPGAL